MCLVAAVFCCCGTGGGAGWWPALQPALFWPQNNLFIARCKAVFPERKVVECISQDGVRFYLQYDFLAIATGSQGSTFGIPGVSEHTAALREIHDAEVRGCVGGWLRCGLVGPGGVGAGGARGAAGPGALRGQRGWGQRGWGQRRLGWLGRCACVLVPCQAVAAV